MEYPLSYLIGLVDRAPGRCVDRGSKQVWLPFLLQLGIVLIGSQWRQPNLSLSSLGAMEFPVSEQNDGMPTFWPFARLDSPFVTHWLL